MTRSSLTRRHLLKRSALAAVAPLLPLTTFAQERRFAPAPGAWRTFDLVTTVSVPEALGTTKLWLPLPDVESDWQKPIENSWTGNATQARLGTASSASLPRASPAAATTAFVTGAPPPAHGNPPERRRADQFGLDAASRAVTRSLSGVGIP